MTRSPNGSYECKVKVVIVVKAGENVEERIAIERWLHKSEPEQNSYIVDIPDQSTPQTRRDPVLAELHCPTNLKIWNALADQPNILIEYAFCCSYSKQLDVGQSKSNGSVNSLPTH